MAGRKLSQLAASRRTRGLSLIELMVALTISAVLIFGATQVYVDSRNAYNVNETIARLQENARYAMSVLEPDVRMANYWGLRKGAGYISNQADQLSAPGAIAPGAQAQYCGTNFALDLNTVVQGDNNQYVLSPSRTGNCDTLSGWNTNAVQSADTLTVRRASTVPLVDGGGLPVETNGIIQVCTTRTIGRLVSTAAPACGTPPDPTINQVSNLIVDAYYVDNNSTGVPGLPSLRRKALSTVPGNIRFVDQEIMAGVEDMQVEFGIENQVGFNALTGVPDRYVNPDAVPANAAIVAVRVWLLMRSETPDIGLVDNRIYQYGDRNPANGAPVGDLNAAGSGGRVYQPSLDATAGINNLMHFRRMLVSRTFQIRNAMGT